MIAYTNIQRHDNIPFKEYLKLGGFSHSFLKRAKNGIALPFKPSDKMKIGSMVDAILTEPEKVDMRSEFYPIGRDIAYQIRQTFGELILSFQKQVSYTADIEYKGFIMKTTGRLDFLLPAHAVIDLKVTDSKDIEALIAFMGYENQGWHYCKMAGVSKFYLMVYSRPLKKTLVYYYDCSSNYNEFWAGKVIDYGTIPTNNVQQIEF